MCIHMSSLKFIIPKLAVPVEKTTKLPLEMDIPERKSTFSSMRMITSKKKEDRVIVAEYSPRKELSKCSEVFSEGKLGEAKAKIKTPEKRNAAKLISVPEKKMKMNKFGCESVKIQESSAWKRMMAKKKEQDRPSLIVLEKTETKKNEQEKPSLIVLEKLEPKKCEEIVQKSEESVEKKKEEEKEDLLSIMNDLDEMELDEDTIQMEVSIEDLLLETVGSKQSDKVQEEETSKKLTWAEEMDIVQPLVAEPWQVENKPEEKKSEAEEAEDPEKKIMEAEEQIRKKQEELQQIMKQLKEIEQREEEELVIKCDEVIEWKKPVKIDVNNEVVSLKKYFADKIEVNKNRSKQRCKKCHGRGHSTLNCNNTSAKELAIMQQSLGVDLSTKNINRMKKVVKELEDLIPVPEDFL